MTEIKPLWPDETISEALDIIVRKPIRDINNEHVLEEPKNAHMMKWTDFVNTSENDWVIKNQQTKDDVDKIVLRNIVRRNIPILEREGD